MTTVVVYKKDSGRIDRVFRGSGMDVSYTPFNAFEEGMLTVENGVTAKNSWIDSGSHAYKSEPEYSVSKDTILADGIDSTIISGIPEYTLVTWPDGQIDTVMDGSVEFTVDLIGTYTITIDPPNQLKYEVSIEAIP